MLDPPRFSAWWTLRLILTKRPLQERLTVFWHNHFAVSGEKVVYGPAMLEYQQVLRKNANGNFRTLLHEVSKTPAMVQYLDTQMSVKGQPNENFAREVMELFTLGVGHFTEQDVKEAARAFTGWGVHYIDLGGATPYEKILERCARQQKLAFNFCEVPALHDGGPKTVLGKTQNFSGDQMLDHLCSQARCPEFLSSKLAKWFIEPPLSTGLTLKLAKTMTESNLDLKPVLRVIAESNEFWSEKNALNRHRSPIDFYVSWFRQMGLRDVLLGLRGDVKDPFKPMKPEVRGGADALTFLMAREGFLLMHPPNVGGWEWGEAWITTSNMTMRQLLPYIIFQGEDKNRPLAQFLAARLQTEFKVKNSAEIVAALLSLFDANLPVGKLPILVEACNKLGGVDSLKDKESASTLLSKISALMVSSPEFQLC